MTYADYLDSDVSPGEVYRSKFGEGITFNPQGKVDYLTGAKFKFKPKETEDQKLTRELAESAERKAKLEQQKNISYSTTEEFEEKLKEIKRLHSMKNK